MSNYRLLDVGGTFIKCADGRAVPVDSAGSRESVAASLREALGDVSGLDGVGIAIPGPFDYRQGIFLMRHKFAAVYGEDFRTLAGLPDGLEIRYGHDVTCILEGAIRRMGLRSNTALVTLGTGLGFAHARDGEVQYNEKSSPARSVYSLPYRDGIIEDYVSARGIQRTYRSKGGDADASVLTIARRAYGGETAALETFAETGAHLGNVLPPVLEETLVDTLLFAGQIARSFSLLEGPLRAALAPLEQLRTIGPAPGGAVFDGLAALF